MTFGQGGDPLVIPSGAIDPTGLPQANFKTLDEVKPSTPLTPDSTPGDASSVFIISQPGSYYLSGNLTVPNQMTGIVITTSNVSLDLSGFTISGESSSLNGIATTSTVSGIRVSNGNIIDLGNLGISASTASSVHLEKLLVRGNESDGARVGTDSICTDSIFRDNSGDGLQIGARSIVRRVVASENSSCGIRPAQTCIVVDVVASANLGNGIDGNDGTAIQNTTASGNGLDGIEVGSGSAISSCTARLNQGRGIDADDGTSVVACSAQGNTRIGIFVENEGVITDCASSNNTENGIESGIRSVIADCSVTDNSGNGISILNECLVRGCIVSNNGSGGAANTDGISGRADNRIENNHLINTSGSAVELTGSNNLIFKNSAVDNSQTDFNFSATSNGGGPIVDGTAQITTNSPWANFVD